MGGVADHGALHERRPALGVADEAVVLHHGRVVLTGPAADLREDRDQVQRVYFGDKER
ncbi:hypothetical protein GCM10009735_00400 [Actinomadura chokoriensis]